MEMETSAEQGNTEAKPSKDSDSKSQFEYEAQFFGYPPPTLLNGIYNAISDVYSDALKAFCTTCYEKYPTAMSEEELRKARQEVGKLIDNDNTKVFDSMENFLLMNVFNIPASVVLPEDKCQLSLPQSETERKVFISQSDQRKMELKQKIIAVKYANAVMSQHLEQAKQFQANLKTIHSSMEASGREAMEVKDHLSYLSERTLTALKSQHTSQK